MSTHYSNQQPIASEPSGAPYGSGHVPAQAGADPRPWAVGAHAGSFLAAWIALGVFAPVLVLVAKGNQSSFVRHHAYESLNFQLNTYLWLVAAFVFGVVTFGLGWVSFLAVGAWYTIFVILASAAANRGEWFRYPMIIRFFKP